MQHAAQRFVGAGTPSVDRRQADRQEAARREIAVVVPVYNSLATLPELVARLKAALETITDDFAVILVDDRGPQPVWPVIAAEAEADRRVQGLRLSRNFGQHAAITAGLSVAHARWYVVMDCDLQDAPEDIPALYRHARAGGHDSVVALRASHDVARRRKLMSIVFNKALERLADIPATSQVGNFRIFNDAMARAFRSYPEKMRLFPALMSHLGFDTGSVPVERADRAEGRSGYTARTLFALAFDAIVSNTIKPMYYLVAFGFAIAFVAMAMAAAIVVQKLVFGAAVAGWASLMTALMMLGGIQIAVMSFVGIYVGKVFMEVKDRPVFIVADATDP